MYIFKAGVVGAGFMGAEIAQVISYSGLPVVLKDVDQELLDKGLARIREIYQRRVDKGKMDRSTLGEKMDLIQGSLTYDGFADVDIVIEAVPEKIELKKQVFHELEEICPGSTIFASNTTALSISEMGAATKKPNKMVGMHFFSPAHVMKLIEVIPGLDTDEETVSDVVTFSESLRKIPVIVQDCPGFLVNRLLMAYLNEAALCLEQGAGTTREIDEAMVKWGWPMGPFTLMDMVGVDICYITGRYLTEEYGDRLQAAKIFQKLYDTGRWGEKVGAGFHGYGDQTDEPVNAMVEEIQSEPGASTGTEFSTDRLMMPMINEAVLCLQEHVASAADIDMAAIAGIGMMMGGERVGPLGAADKIGLDVVLAKMEQFKKELGPRFHPARLLSLHVRANHLGEKTGRGFLEHVS